MGNVNAVFAEKAQLERGDIVIPGGGDHPGSRAKMSGSADGGTHRAAAVQGQVIQGGAAFPAGHLFQPDDDVQGGHAQTDDLQGLIGLGHSTTTG